MARHPGDAPDRAASSVMHSLDPTEDFAIRLVRRFLLLCEHPRTRQRVLRLVRQSTRSGPEGPRLYAWINRAVVHPMLVRGGIPASAMKVELVASQLVGLAMVRYVLKVEPMASAPVDEVVLLAAPAIRAALAGDEAFSPAATVPRREAVPARRRLRAPRLPGVRAVRRTAARVRGLV